MVKIITTSHTHLAGHVHKNFELECMDRLVQHLEKTYPQDNCVVIMAKSHAFYLEEYRQDLIDCLTSNQYRVFFVNVLDPSEIESLLSRLELDETNCNFSEVGDTLALGPYSFDCLSWLTKDNFQLVSDKDLLPRAFEKIYISYSRKPRVHRVMLTDALIKNNLEDCGIITLGIDVGHPLHRNIGEQPEDFRSWGSMALPNPHDCASIPHTLWSLGNLNLWQTHFLHIVNETNFNDYELTNPIDGNTTKRLFLSEKIWKPMIGLRPFVLCMNPKIWYPWLEDNGFRTFEQYWPVSFRDIRDQDKCQQTIDNIVEVIRWLQNKTPEELKSLYESMLPDIYHNRDRFNRYAEEQKNKYLNCLR